MFDVCLHCDDEKIYDDISSMNLPSFRITEDYLWQKLHKFMANTVSKDSPLYTIVSVSYDGLCKRL